MGQQTDAGRVAGLVGLLFGLAGMGSAAVAVTLPAIAADLDLTTGGVSWVISLYALMLAVATAIYGRAADLAGIRLPLLIGIGLMAGSAVLGCFAPSIEVLLAARLLQGMERPPSRSSAWRSSVPATTAPSGPPHWARWPGRRPR